MTQNFEPNATSLPTNQNEVEATLSDAVSSETTSSDTTKLTQAGFERFNLCPNLTAAIEKSGYTVPTPIQEQAIPVLMEGRDVLGIAQTGTGKTAAFALPILQKIMTTKHAGLQALVLVPTRELAVQVCAAFRQLAGRSSVRATTIFGGQSFGLQVKELRTNPDIVVACPGRLLDHVTRRTIRLDSVSMLVLDEADQMFDMGFLPTVRELIKELGKKRQSMLFSATMPSEIKSLAMEVLSNPQTVQVASTETAATIHHKLYGVSQAQKTDMLVKLVSQSDAEAVLVFARTKQRTKRLHDALYNGGVSATSLQGNLSQQQRDKSMKGFRAGKFKVMVATDIASRGIDVASIGLVINFDMPMTTETYTHRVGRTGRALRSGTAVTLACPEDRSMVRLLERRLKVGFEHASIEGFDRVDLSGGNADEAGRPQYGKRAGGGSRSGGRRFGGGSRDGGGRSYGDRSFGDRRSSSDAPNSERRDHNDRVGRQARRGDGAGASAPTATSEGAPRAEGRFNREPRGESRGGYAQGNNTRGSEGRFNSRGPRSEGRSSEGRSFDNRGSRFGGQSSGGDRPYRSNNRGPRSDAGNAGDRNAGDNRQDRYAAAGERSESFGNSARPQRSNDSGTGSRYGGGRSGGGYSGGRSQGDRSSNRSGSTRTGGFRSDRGIQPRGERPTT